MEVAICPKCGRKMFPSRIKEYAWECLECDEDFYDFEIHDRDFAEIEMDTYYTIGKQELKSMLHYDMIAETFASTRWNTGKRKRLLDNRLNGEECKISYDICHKCINWYLKKGLPENIKITYKELYVWFELIRICELL